VTVSLREEAHRTLVGEEEQRLSGSHAEDSGGGVMAKMRVTRDTLRAMAGLSGLDISDDELKELLPQVQRTLENMVGLDVLDLGEVEPAVSFKAREE
jgi:hypothetical protein